MKSRPASSASRASARQSGQLADQRSGTLVADRPDEQFAPKRPIFKALPLYMASRLAVLRTVEFGVSMGIAPLDWVFFGGQLMIAAFWEFNRIPTIVMRIPLR